MVQQLARSMISQRAVPNHFVKLIRHGVPSPLIELSRSGTAPWTFGSIVYSLPHGQGATLPRSAQLNP